MKRKLFEVQNIRVWGVMPREYTVVLNVAGKNITPNHVKQAGTLKDSSGQSYKVVEAIDPYPVKHKNRGKFIEAYLEGGALPGGSSDRGGNRRTTEIR